MRFFINRTEREDGPSIFGYRLKEEIERNGWKWNPVFPQTAYIFSVGLFRPFCRNILRLDGLYFDKDNLLYNTDKSNRRIFRRYWKADAIVFQSEFNCKQFQAFAGEPKCPYKIIPNGIPRSFSPSGEKVDYGFEKTLITSAKWRPNKRLDSIVEGFLEYGPKETGLVVLGDGVGYKVDHPNIKYLGNIEPSQLPKHLRGGDAFIYLSWIDHCPNSVVEALGCGLPVLCTHNGGTKEIVRQNGIVLQIDEDYDFKKVSIYQPPKCDKIKVAEAIDRILNWDRPVEADYLKIESVAAEYMAFAEQNFL